MQNIKSIEASEVEDMDEADPTEIDSFSESFAPVNNVNRLLFRLRDKVCCVGLLVIVAAFMRFFLAK